MLSTSSCGVTTVDPPYPLILNAILTVFNLAPKAPGHVTLKQRQWPWYPDGTVECRMKFNRAYEMLRQLYDKPLDTSRRISTSPCSWTLGARKRTYIESSDYSKRPTKRRWGGMDDGNDDPGQEEPSRCPSWFWRSAECRPVFDRRISTSRQACPPRKRECLYLQIVDTTMMNAIKWYYRVVRSEESRDSR